MMNIYAGDIVTAINAAEKLLIRLKGINSPFIHKACREYLLLSRVLRFNSTGNIVNERAFPDSVNGIVQYDLGEKLGPICLRVEDGVSPTQTPLEILWVKEDSADTAAWKNTTAKFMNDIRAADDLSYSDLYNVTHYVFFLTDFGRRRVLHLEGLHVACIILQIYLDTDCDNLDLRLESLIALYLCSRDIRGRFEIDVAKNQLERFFSVDPSVCRAAESSIYSQFHATTVYALLLHLLNSRNVIIQNVFY